MFFLILLLTSLEFSGFAETRSYIAFGDSINIFGYNRGWLEWKYDKDNYGTQIGFDCIVPYDSVGFISLIEKINISRLALYVGPERLRITAGKQRLYWGVGRVFRPLDIFNPVNYFEPDYERPGSNAILGIISLGQLSNLRFVCVPKHNIKELITGLRIGTNFLENDIGFNALHKSEPQKDILGIEIAGEAAFGYWSELSYVIDDTLKYFKTDIGFDYTFPFFVYGMLEFFYDQSGAVSPSDYEWQKLINGERQTLAEKYFYLNLSLTRNPFCRPGLSSIINSIDRGFILIPQISYSVTDNVELFTGLNLFFGSENSEFKNLIPYNGQYYIWLKVYF